VKEKLLNDWKNVYLQQSSDIAYEEFYTLMINNSYEKKELRKLLDDYGYDQF